MKEVLIDLLKQTPNTIKTVVINGEENSTVIKAVDADKVVIIESRLHKPEPKFVGTFGITNLKLLNGLLNFANYRTEDAKFETSIMTNKRDNKEFVESFKFVNEKTGNSAEFKTITPDLAPEQATIGKVPWDVSFYPEKSKISEFKQLYSLYSEIDSRFYLKTMDNELLLMVGSISNQNHSGSMVLKSNIEGNISSLLTFDANHFISILDMMGTNETTISITSRNLLLVTVKTDYGTYDYYLRGAR